MIFNMFDNFNSLDVFIMVFYFWGIRAIRCFSSYVILLIM